jgi:glycine/D-amino acid oxidase-like deaminating enzyme
LSNNSARDCDIAVIGGGLVGTAIAYGLANGGRRVVLFDEGDRAFRASRGNFALVWVQSKGLGLPVYGGWSKRSSDLWPGFAGDLIRETGIDLAYERPGGFSICLSEDELGKLGERLNRMHNQPETRSMETRLMTREEMDRHLPGLGPAVVGGAFCPYDGHLNSQALLAALHLALRQRGVSENVGMAVDSISPLPGGGFAVTQGGTTFEAGRVVLAAGLGNIRLAPMVGLRAHVRPQRGQVLVTQRVAPFLRYPTLSIRQTREGTVMLGDSQEEVGFDVSTSVPVTAAIARRAVQTFPALAAAPIARSWAALRVMTEDGFPIYAESETAPGAFLATCHSGVTLAAAHARLVAPMIAAGAIGAELDAFSPRRFDVSTPR